MNCHLPRIGLVHQAGKPKHSLEGVLLDSLDHLVLDLVPSDRVDAAGRAVVDGNDLLGLFAINQLVVVVQVAAQPAGHDAHLKNE